MLRVDSKTSRGNRSPDDNIVEVFFRAMKCALLHEDDSHAASARESSRAKAERVVLDETFVNSDREQKFSRMK